MTFALLTLALAASGFVELEPGLELAVFDGPPAPAGDAKIRVLRADPARFSPALLNASSTAKRVPLTARAWAEKAGAVATINASMYQTDHLRSVSFQRSGAHVNNPQWSKDRSLLAFDPFDPKDPPVRLLDKDCDDFEAAKKKYRSLVQSIRMLSCDGENVWAKSERRWSTAAIGQDDKGRLLFIHARSPWPVHDFVDALMALPIGLSRAMYVEGGPEATLFVKAGKVEAEMVGSYETGFWEDDQNAEAWEVPNVVALLRRPAEAKGKKKE
jgi:hypothetical protein